MSNGYLKCNNNSLSFDSASNIVKSGIGTSVIVGTSTPIYWNGASFTSVSTSGMTVGNATNAVNATKDSDGNIISSTYLPLSANKDLTGYLSWQNKADSGWNEDLTKAAIRSVGAPGDTVNGVSYFMSLQTYSGHWGLGTYNYGASSGGYGNQLLWHYTENGAESNVYPYIAFDPKYGIVVTTNNTGITHNRSGRIVRFGVGSGGINRGIYDDNLSKWMIYNPSTTSDNYISTSVGRIVTTKAYNSNDIRCDWNNTETGQAGLFFYIDGRGAVLKMSYSNISDRQLKKNFVSYDSIKDIYLDFKPTYFNYKDNPYRDSKTINNGLIAQDIIQTFEKNNLDYKDFNLVYEIQASDSDKIYLDGKDTNYMVNYDFLHGYHIKFGQEIYKELSDKIKALEERIAQLEANA